METTNKAAAGKAGVRGLRAFNAAKPAGVPAGSWKRRGGQWMVQVDLGEGRPGLRVAVRRLFGPTEIVTLAKFSHREFYGDIWIISRGSGRRGATS